MHCHSDKEPLLHFRIYCYPWDLVDEGVSRVMGNFVRWGLDTASVSPAYHRAQCLNPRNPKRKTFVAEQSYVYFEPKASGYEAIGITPEPSPDGSRWFHEVAATAHTLGQPVSAWMVGLHYSPHFRQYSRYWCHNVFGEPYPLSLCPSHVEVQSYLVALAADVRDQFGVSEIELESFNWDRFFNSTHELHDRIGVSLGPIDNLALSLCFCVACVTRATELDIDVGRLRAKLRTTLMETLRTGHGLQGAERDIIDHFSATCPELPLYLDLRGGVVEELVTKIDKAVDCPVSMIYYSPFLSGIDPSGLSRVCERLTLLAYSAEADMVADIASSALQTISDPGRWRVILSLFAEHVPDPDRLTQHVGVLRELGFSDIGFYNYGLASDNALECMRRAIRAYL